MDCIPPLMLMEEVEAASRVKAALSAQAMPCKGFLSGVLLAYATAFAFKVSPSVGQWLFRNRIPVKPGNTLSGTVPAGLLQHYCNRNAKPGETCPARAAAAIRH